MVEKTNNPFNIRYYYRTKWLGQLGKYKGFVVFGSLDYGVRAGIVLLRNYIRKGYNTPSLIIHRYAPPFENNTDKYISYVCSVVGCSPDHEIIYKSMHFYLLLKSILYFESRFIFKTSEYSNIIKKFNL